jgi:hypothetical protein
MVERTSVSLLERSSACEIGVGNFPATEGMSEGGEYDYRKQTLGETGAKETGNLLDEGLGRQEGIVLFGELLNKLLVLVKSAVSVSTVKDKFMNRSTF